MIRVVLDTSVVVSAVISPTGPNAQVFDLILSGKIVPCVSPAILAEYRAVFDYDHLQGLDRRRVDRFISLLETVGKQFRPRARLNISRHDDDNRIYECAAAARARYIVTENTKHFPAPFESAEIRYGSAAVGNSAGNLTLRLTLDRSPPPSQLTASVKIFSVSDSSLFSSRSLSIF